MNLTRAITNEKCTVHGTPKTAEDETEEGRFGYERVSPAWHESASKIVTERDLEDCILVGVL